MRRRLVLVAVILVALGSSLHARASADSGAATYRYLIGTGLLCGLAPSACPDVAMAPNGDTIVLTGSGTLSIHPKSVTGGGTFVHKRGAATVGSGTWTATQLLSFVGYGCGGAGLPANFCGGRAIIRVHLSAGLDAILQVDCLIGTFPAGAIEGVRLAVPGALNFNKEVSGFTLFIRP